MAEERVVRIKRLAQFLFDNALLIDRYLLESPNYRSFEVKLNMFKHQPVEFQIGLQLYDEVAGIYELEEASIYRKRFAHIKKQINENAGVIRKPEPIEVRDKLEVNHAKEES